MKTTNSTHNFHRNVAEPSLYFPAFLQATNQLSTNEYFGTTNPNPMKLPVHYKNQPIHLSYGKDGFGFQLEGKQFYFIVNTWVLWFIIVTLLFFFLRPWIAPSQQIIYQNSPTEFFASSSKNHQPYSQEDNIYLMKLSEDVNESDVETDVTKEFIVQKQLLVAKFLIDAKVARVDQLENESLLQLNQEVSDLFKNIVLDNIEIEPHVYSFLTDSLPLKIIETSLMEQAKFNIPASIKLAQSALETAYGRYVKHNNYFGIKSKAMEGEWINTLEYYSPEELKLNQSKIISKQKLEIDGKTIYKCRVRDKFKTYNSAWNSFRAHSLFLSSQKRYAPLFTNGKDYKAWAKKIGSTKHGGVGYATLPVYGELLTKIIDRYHLHLLDY